MESLLQEYKSLDNKIDFLVYKPITVKNTKVLKSLREQRRAISEVLDKFNIEYESLDVSR